MTTSNSGAPKSGPLMTAYVEVNDNSIANAGRYVLAKDGSNVFDIALVFAANINHDDQKGTYLGFNPHVQDVLDNAGKLIKPLRDKGIRVLLSVLGNHQGVGFANFPDQPSAAAFADQLAAAVTRYGLDGIDFDDEYADYPTSGEGQTNTWSFPYLVDALRTKLGKAKTISLYFIGPSSRTLTYGDIDVGRLIDYSWNAGYGSFDPPDVPGLGKARLAAAAIDIQDEEAGGWSTAADLAKQTLDQGYGVYNTYRLPDTDVSTGLSAVTKVLYNSDVRPPGTTEPAP
ncbi:endo-beta-N-acetylglucosaminidase H [Kitasatospora sp. NPDC018619]|uniref:endo-beta-N-acetylglucosaminidase H n=1 Tax=unclassified Kitasatospora TaxID=2633591 RepID=UPI0037BD4681